MAVSALGCFLVETSKIVEASIISPLLKLAALMDEGDQPLMIPPLDSQTEVSYTLARITSSTPIRPGGIGVWAGKPTSR